MKNRIDEDGKKTALPVNQVARQCKPTFQLQVVMSHGPDGETLASKEISTEEFISLSWAADQDGETLSSFLKQAVMEKVRSGET